MGIDHSNPHIHSTIVLCDVAGNVFGPMYKVLYFLYGASGAACALHAM